MVIKTRCSFLTSCIFLLGWGSYIPDFLFWTFLFWTREGDIWYMTRYSWWYVCNQVLKQQLYSKSWESCRSRCPTPEYPLHRSGFWILGKFLFFRKKRTQNLKNKKPSVQTQGRIPRLLSTSHQRPHKVNSLVNNGPGQQNELCWWFSKSEEKRFKKEMKIFIRRFKKEMNTYYTLSVDGEYRISHPNRS